MQNNANSIIRESSTADLPLPPAPSSPINIWLVDDSQRVRATLMEILGRCEGIRCTGSFHSPNAMLSALASKAGPDVILLDIQMGEVCGLDAIRPIKSLSRSTQVLMLTTFFDQESKNRALTDGASDFLLKGFPIEQIVSSIQRAAKNPAPHVKRTRKQKCAAASAEQTSAAGNLPNRMPWVKSCLSLFRNRSN